MKTLWILVLSLLAFASCTDDVDSDNSSSDESDSVTDTSSKEGDSQSDEDTSSSQSNTGDDPKDTGTGSGKDTGSQKDTGTGKDTGSGKDSDTSDALPATNGSCKAPNGFCSDYIGSSFTTGQMKSSCEAGGAGYEWLTGHCPVPGRVGMCRFFGETAGEFIASYYAPDWTKASAQKNCSDGGGTWM